MKSFSLFILLVSVCFSQVSAQIGTWKTYSSFNNVKEVITDQNGVYWAATSGGLMSAENGIVTQQKTTVDGLYRLDPETLLYDETNHRLFLGYTDGMIDIYDINSGTTQRLEDIKRASTFSSRSVNRFLIKDNRLYVATEFGIVMYNLETLLVIDSFSKLGSFNRAIAVNDIHFIGDNLWAATLQGAAVGNISNNLSVEENWDNFDDSNGFTAMPVRRISSFEGRIYASTADDNYDFDGLDWSISSDFINGAIRRYHINEAGNRFSGFGNNNATVLDQNLNRTFHNLPTQRLNSAMLSGSDLILIASFNSGIIEYELSSGDSNVIQADGPQINFVTDISFINGGFIAGSTQFWDRDALFDNQKGYYIYRDGEWTSFNRANNATLNSFDYRKTYQTAVSNNYYYFGSWGYGIARHHIETDEIHVFNNTNSSIRGWVSVDPDYEVISGVQTDRNDRVWAVSRFGPTPLYTQIPGEDNWIARSTDSALSAADLYEDLFIDSNDRKWITLKSSSSAGRGLLVLQTPDPEDPTMDTGVRLTDDFDNGNLPNINVKSVIEDMNGEIWIGTDRGIARFVFPQFILSGGSNERRAQWLINEDPNAESPFLLRDINVTAMAINGANQKWIGTPSEGIWLLNEQGSRILAHYTTENSPLLSNAIRSISVEPETGEVFIATELGLVSFMDIPRSAEGSMNTLKVFPNPFEYGRHSRIIIDGLGDETTIRIMGVDGTLVNSLDARGGRAEWNGYDSRGNELGSGVYLVIALDKNNGQRGVGKVVIIR
jgi:hypothetical protein